MASEPIRNAQDIISDLSRQLAEAQRRLKYATGTMDRGILKAWQERDAANARVLELESENAGWRESLRNVEADRDAAIKTVSRLTAEKEAAERERDRAKAILGDQFCPDHLACLTDGELPDGRECIACLSDSHEAQKHSLLKRIAQLEAALREIGDMTNSAMSGGARQVAQAALATPGSGEQCQHDRLDEDGQCRSCGADKRGIGIGAQPDPLAEALTLAEGLVDKIERARMITPFPEGPVVRHARELTTALKRYREGKRG